MSHILAALAAETGPALNTDGVRDWVMGKILPLILLALGVAVIGGARKGKLSENALTVTNVLIGLVLVCGAGALYALTSGVVDIAVVGVK